MSQRRRNGYWLLILTLFVLSCDVSTLAAPAPIPSPNPNTINIIVAMTAGAAATQTAVLIPPTLTPSFTPFPSQTPSITPTATGTFVFTTPTMIKFTKTPTPTKSKGSGGGGGGGGGGGSSGGGSNTGTWACTLTAQAPVNGTSFKASTSFTANWTLQNTGSNTWLHTSVDVTNIGGTLMAANTAYDTLSDVPVGGSTTISVPMTAPSSTGTYTSNWTLRVGKELFCPIAVTISVQ